MSYLPWILRIWVSPISVPTHSSPLRGNKDVQQIHSRVVKTLADIHATDETCWSLKTPEYFNQTRHPQEVQNQSLNRRISNYCYYQFIGLLSPKITGWDCLDYSTFTSLHFVHPISCSVGAAPLCLISLLWVIQHKILWYRLLNILSSTLPENILIRKQQHDLAYCIANTVSTRKAAEIKTKEKTSTVGLCWG